MSSPSQLEGLQKRCNCFLVHSFRCVDVSDEPESTRLVRGRVQTWKTFVLPLLKARVDCGLNQYFRLGQSMADIIFSTADQHCLESYDPPPARVTLRRDRTTREIRWFIAYSHWHIAFSEAERKSLVNATSALPILKSHLADLWRETCPNETLPEPLATSQLS